MKIKHIMSALIASLLLSLSVIVAQAQSQAEIEEATAKGMALMKKGDFAAAVPYLNTLVIASPNDADLRFIYGFALIAKSKQVDDPAQAQKLSASALVQLKEAKNLGMKSPELDTLLQMLDPKSDAGASATASPAEKYFAQAEAFFAQSKYDQALEMYKKALEADPKMYKAALYIGDVYTQKQDWDNAEKSYQKAISIDPMLETAYRYSGTPLMKQKKYDQARDRYIEAYVTEPYNEMSARGISQWAEVMDAKLAHPKIDIPEMKYDASGKPTTVMNENSLTTGSKAWVAYSLTRVNWYREKFTKLFPNEKTYRHTLQEEAEAIRSVLKKAKDEKLNHPHFDILQKLDSEGLLEAFILLSKADEGIAKDHPAYLRENRTKLIQYVTNYIIQK